MTVSIRNTFGALVVVLGAALLAEAKRVEKKPPYEWAPVTAFDWSMAADSTKGIKDAAIIFERVTVDDSLLNKERSVRTVYRRVRILTSEGRKQADVDVPFLVTDQVIDDIQARTVLPDSRVITLMPEAIIERQVVRVEGEKVMQKRFSIPGVTDNCIVEYMIRYVTKGYVGRWDIQSDIPLMKGELHWKYYNTRAAEDQFSGGDRWDEYFRRYFQRLRDFYGTPNHVWCQINQNRRVKQVPMEKPTEYLFEVWDMPKLPDEPYSPPPSQNRARLLFYYGQKDPPAVFWGIQAASTRAFDSSFCAESDRCKKVAENFAALPTVGEKIDAVYRWVHDSIKNLSYNLSTEVADSFKQIPEWKIKNNRTVDDVIKHKYGDRPDINLVFCQILRELGIDAKFGYAKDRTEGRFESQAKVWQFDRSLVAVPIESTLVGFFAPGEPFAPFGMVPWFNEGSAALIEGNANIFFIPSSSAQRTTEKIQYDFALGEEAALRGTLRSRLSGHAGRERRLDIYDKPEQDRTDHLRTGLKVRYPDADIDSVHYDGLDDVTGPFLVECRLSFPSPAVEGTRLFLRPFSYARVVKDGFDSDKRVTPIEFKYAHIVQEVMKFDLAPGWFVEGRPPDTAFANNIGQWAIRSAETESSVSIFRTFTLTAPTWDTSQYRNVRQLFETGKQLSDVVIVLAKR